MESKKVTRRQVLVGGATLVAASQLAGKALAQSPSPSVAPATGPFTLKPLPYAPDALAPHISATTLDLHHGKHHATYVKKTNELVAGRSDVTTLEALIQEAAKDESKKALFNNAAQIWNHDFYWSSLRPKGGGAPPKGKLADAIDKDLGGWEGLRKKLAELGGKHFGSGYVWLVKKGEKLDVITTTNAENPLTLGDKALLTIDLWEHSYYVDRQNRRPEYLDAVLDNLLNWEFAEANLG